MPDAPELRCYLPPGVPFHIRAASPRRAWMDATPQQHAYHCLPLTIANSHGWEICCTQPVLARWSGGPTQADLSVKLLGTATRTAAAPALSAFGSGILTFRIPVLFRTPPGINLWVLGPINHPRDGAAPLSGIVETDWLIEHSFTMNWKLTRPGLDVLFAAGEPLCHICPIPRGFVESFVPRLLALDPSDELHAIRTQAAERRRTFQRALGAEESATLVSPGPDQGRAWERRYFQGTQHDGTPAPDHQTRLGVQDFPTTPEPLTAPDAAPRRSDP